MTPIDVSTTKNQGKFPAPYRDERNTLEMILEARDSLQMAQRRMKKHVDQTFHSLDFNVGNQWFLKLNPRI